MINFYTQRMDELEVKDLYLVVNCLLNNFRVIIIKIQKLKVS